MSLRRSIIGSLKSASRKSTLTIVAEPSNRSDSCTPTTPRIFLNSVKEEHPTPTPDLDREVDLLIIGSEPIDKAVIFEELLGDLPGASRDHPLFKLPTFIRRKTYGYCFPEEEKRVNLSPKFAIKAVFKEEHFASPWDILEPVAGGLRAFRSIRYELMTYFWTEYNFHVTLTMFTGPRFSPLSHVWLPQYLDIIQHLTIETDLTRFGGSAMKMAPKFGYNLEKLETMLIDIVKGLIKRRGRSTMAEFNLMCRRYAGFRPLDHFHAEGHDFDGMRPLF